MAMEIDIDKIRKLVELMQQSYLTEITIRTDEGRITIKRDWAALASVTAPADAQAEAASEEAEAQPLMITSPWVGTFHRSTAPGGQPLVEVGDVVEEGQVVCIVESLRVQNEVHAPARGIISQILVEDGQSVEYGQPLMVIEPESTTERQSIEEG